IGGTIADGAATGLLAGAPEHWVEMLGGFASRLGVGTVVFLRTDGPGGAGGARPPRGPAGALDRDARGLRVRARVRYVRLLAHERPGRAGRALRARGRARPTRRGGRLRERCGAEPWR